MESKNKPPREALIVVMAEAGCSRAEIDARLATYEYAPLSQQEAIEAKLALPEVVTAADIAPAPEAPKINKGVVLGKNPATGEDFSQLNMAVVGLCGAVSKILKVTDPAAWATYKAMKAAGTKDAKQNAYAWAFSRLLELGYVPTAKD